MSFSRDKSSTYCRGCYQKFSAQRRPKLLACDHTICSSCLHRSSFRGTQKIRCSICKEVTVMPVGGISGIKENIKACVSVGLLKHTRCSLCEQKGYVTLCHDCSKDICLDCTEKHKRQSLRRMDTLAERVQGGKEELGTKATELNEAVGSVRDRGAELKEKISKTVEAVVRSLLECETTLCHEVDECLQEVEDNFDKIQAVLDKRLDKLKSFYESSKSVSVSKNYKEFVEVHNKLVLHHNEYVVHEGSQGIAEDIKTGTELFNEYVVSCERQLQSLGKMTIFVESFQQQCTDKQDVYARGKEAVVDALEGMMYEGKGQLLREVRGWAGPSGEVQYFDDPRGVAVNRVTDEVFVTDAGKHVVCVFDDSGRFLRSFGSHGNGLREFNKPSGIAVIKNEKVVVCDSWNDRLQLWTPSGEYMRDIKPPSSDFKRPWYVATDDQSQIYVTMCYSKKCRVYVFDIDGIVIRQVATPINNVNTNLKPTYIAGGSGTIVLTDQECRKIEVFEIDKDDINQSTLVANGMFCSAPKGVAMDGSGAIFVADVAKQRVFVMRAHGGLIGSFKMSEFAAMSYHWCFLAVTSNGSVLITDGKSKSLKYY